MSGELKDKDQLIAFLITQNSELQKNVKEINEKLLELTIKQNEARSEETRAISLSQLQTMAMETKSLNSKIEDNIRKVVDIIVTNKAQFGF